MALGNILTVICIAIPFWKQNDPQDTFNDFIIRVREKADHLDQGA